MVLFVIMGKIEFHQRHIAMHMLVVKYQNDISEQKYNHYGGNSQSKTAL